MTLTHLVLFSFLGGASVPLSTPPGAFVALATTGPTVTSAAPGAGAPYGTYGSGLYGAGLYGEGETPGATSGAGVTPSTAGPTVKEKR